MTHPAIRHAIAAAALAALALSGFAAGPPPKAQAESEVKAVFLVNFLRYLEWPEENGLPFCPIVVLGDSPIFEPLREISEKNKPGMIPIQVRRCADLDDAGFPRILFLSPSSASLLPKVLDKFRGKDTLIVGETEGLAARGAAINFVLREETVKFEVSVKALKAAGIQAGSQLLRLAILVDGGEKTPGP